MTTEGPAGTPPAPGTFSRLTAAQCERLHEATLRVLERTGLLVEEPEALELLRRAGAEVDGARVRLGARLVDALPNYDFVMSLFTPSDVTPQAIGFR